MLVYPPHLFVAKTVLVTDIGFVSFDDFVLHAFKLRRLSSSILGRAVTEPIMKP